VNTALAGVAATAVAVVVTPLCIRLASRLQIVDRPGPAKPQAQAVPYLGGLAVLAAVAVPIGIARPAILLPAMLAAALEYEQEHSKRKGAIAAIESEIADKESES